LVVIASHGCMPQRDVKKLKTILKKILRRPLYEKLKRYVYYGTSDIWDSISGQRDDLVPPKSMVFIGGSAYKEVGDEFFGYFKTLGGLKPTDCVLDVGCGIGRMARPLTGYLTSGKYEGFDIDKTGIDWCKKNISPRFPNFRFVEVDIFNKHYNPSGREKASQYKFPYADETFDFVYLTSVFTHMFPDDVVNYLGEISRVMKKGGTCVISYFIWNDESSSLVHAGKSGINFKRQTDGFFVMDENVPEDATCFSDEFLFGAYAKFGLKITTPIHFGHWCGRDNGLSYQDLLIAKKA